MIRNLLTFDMLINYIKIPVHGLTLDVANANCETFPAKFKLIKSSSLQTAALLHVP